jgi:HTH-type transcriptional regulator, competence development regulator
MLVKLAEALRDAREELDLSLAAVAKPAGISAAYLHKLERGVVDNPSPRVLARIAAALKMPYLRLMELAGYLDEMQPAEARKRGPSAKDHPLAGQRLTPAEWRAVGEFIEELYRQRGAGTGRGAESP